MTLRTSLLKNKGSFGRYTRNIPDDPGVPPIIWHPQYTEAAGSMLWFDFTDTSKITTSGGTITQVVSKQSPGRPLTITQGTAASQPVIDLTYGGVLFGSGKSLVIPNQTRAYDYHKWFLAIARLNPNSLANASHTLLHINGSSTSASQQQPSLVYAKSNGFTQFQTVNPSGVVKGAGRSIGVTGDQWFYILGWRTADGVLYARVNAAAETAGNSGTWFISSNTGTTGLIGGITGLDMTLFHLIIGQDWMTTTLRDRLMGWSNAFIMTKNGGSSVLDPAHTYYSSAPQISQAELDGRYPTSPTSYTAFDALQVRPTGISDFAYGTFYNSVDLSGLTVAKTITCDSLTKISGEFDGTGPIMDRGISDTKFSAFRLKSQTPATIAVVDSNAFRFYYHRPTTLGLTYSSSLQTVNRSGSPGTSGISQRGGYFEATIRLWPRVTPDINGVFVPEARPSFWLKSTNFFTNAYRPYCEIDVFENYSAENPSSLHTSFWLHRADFVRSGDMNGDTYNGTGSTIRTKKLDGTQSNSSSVLSDADKWNIPGNPGLFDGNYHVYGILFPPPGTTTGWVICYLDGKEICRHPMIPEWDVEMYMIFWVDHPGATDTNNAGNDTQIINNVASLKNGLAFAQQTVMDVKDIRTLQWNGY